MIVNHLIADKSASLLEKLYILPVANPDEVIMHNRWNARNVDLNRNWPTKDWTPELSNPRYPPGPSANSEVETQVLQRLISRHNFDVIVDLHSYKESVVLPLLANLSALLEAQIAAFGSDLKVPVVYEQADLGYSIAGGFHTWCFENEISNITLEIEKGLGQFAIKDKNLTPTLKFLDGL